jgi:hypothetical protein
MLAASKAFSPAAAWKLTFLSVVIDDFAAKTTEKDGFYHPAEGNPSRAENGVIDLVLAA